MSEQCDAHLNGRRCVWSADHEGWHSSGYDDWPDDFEREHNKLTQRIAELEAKNKRLEAENMSYEKQCNAYIAQIEAQEINDE